MKNISMIACVGENLELGKNNDLLWHLPNDLKFFKEKTLGKTETPEARSRSPVRPPRR